MKAAVCVQHRKSLGVHKTGVLNGNRRPYRERFCQTRVFLRENLRFRIPRAKQAQNFPRSNERDAQPGMEVRVSFVFRVTAVDKRIYGSC